MLATKAEVKGLLFVGPFVPLSQIPTTTFEEMANYLIFLVSSHKWIALSRSTISSFIIDSAVDSLWCIFFI